MLFDSHAHLDLEEYQKDRDAVIERARAAGVERVVLIGLWRRPGEFGDARALCRRWPDLFSATVGIHPHEAARVPEEDWAAAERMAGEPDIVAVGEAGLDFHYDHSPRPVQQEAFRRSIAMARAAGKPLVVHVREADSACVEALRAEGVPPAGGVIHCFTGDWQRARSYLDLGLHLSVAGVITFRNADELREAVRRVPRDRLFIETDCPFLAPIPHRGQRNEPAYVARVAERVAELWETTADEAARITGENARRFFRIR